MRQPGGYGATSGGPISLTAPGVVQDEDDVAFSPEPAGRGSYPSPSVYPRDRGPAPLRAWPQIVAFAVASDDEHVIKLVDSCREQERVYGGDVWRRAASRVLAKG